MDDEAFFKTAPPLDPVWLEHEKQAGLLKPQPTLSIKDRQPLYNQACRDRNASMLAGRDSHLATGIETIDSNVTASDGWQIPIRTYTVKQTDAGFQSEDLIIYYHGGGLRVGDLDSEDLSCRRICKEASVTVISVDYRLMGDHSPGPNIAVLDAYDSFVEILASRSPKRLALVGSSSGGQLAAQVTQLARDSQPSSARKVIDGILLRCPVTANTSEGGVHFPARFREMHTSFSPSFQTSVLCIDEDAAREKSPNLPLEAKSFEELPRTFMQVCSNDIYYSDGVCYAHALINAGVEVKVDLWKGWPHMFWLIAPLLEQSLEAEIDMIQGLKWLLDSVAASNSYN